MERSLTSLPFWRWEVGMFTEGMLSRGVVVSVRDGMVTVCERGLLRLLQPNEEPCLLPPTVGWLVEFLQEAKDDAGLDDVGPYCLSVPGDEQAWVVQRPSAIRQTLYPSFPSAVVAALFHCAQALSAQAAAEHEASLKGRPLTAQALLATKIAKGEP